MTVTKKILVLLLFLASQNAMQAQTTLNLYPVNGTIGLRFFSESKFSLEPRLNFQVDLDGDVNLFVNSELMGLINFRREENFAFYSGLGLGASIFNQSQSVFLASVPLGFTWYPANQHRLGVVGECGLKLSAAYAVSVHSYATAGVQIQLHRGDNPK